jgi:Calcineurin-like phosphoesterase
MSTRARTLGVIFACAALGCRERAARFMGMDASAASLPASPAEDESEVHFSFTGPTSVAFSWHGSGRTLRIWSRTSAPREIEAHEPDPRPFSGPGPWKEAVVAGLEPGVEYGYEIGRPRFPVPSFFRAPLAHGTAGFSFVAVAGLGAAVDFPEVGPLYRLISLEDPAFVLGLGDLTFADVRSQPSVDRHFDDVMVWSRKAAYMPVWGEHEWRTQNRDDLRNYKGRFALPHAQTSPGAPKAGCCGEDWYWFDYGNARFISYPEPYTDATWDDWAAKAGPLFDEAERDPAIAFTITMGHRPAFSSAREGGDPRLRRLLDGFGVRSRKYVLDLSGHAGAYERTKAITHVVHIVTGPGGGELDHAETACFWQDCVAPDFTAFRAIHHAFLRVAVRPTSLKIEAFCGLTAPGRDDIHCAEGDIFDQLSIDAPKAATALR